MKPGVLTAILVLLLALTCIWKVKKLTFPATAGYHMSSSDQCMETQVPEQNISFWRKPFALLPSSSLEWRCAIRDTAATTNLRRIKAIIKAKQPGRRHLVSWWHLWSITPSSRLCISLLDFWGGSYCTWFVTLWWTWSSQKQRACLHFFQYHPILA